MRKRTISSSILCLLLALPSVALAEANPGQTPQTTQVVSGEQVKTAVNATAIGALAGDFTVPVLVNATVSPTSISVGEEVTITAQVSDESGVKEVVAFLNHNLGYKELPLTLDPDTGEWKGTYTITELDPNGTWWVDFKMTDNAGNFGYEYAPGDLQVVNSTGGDVEVPTLGPVVISPLKVGPNEEFTIRATVNDNNEVAKVTAAIYNPNANGILYVPLTKDTSTNEWVGSSSFNESDMAGTWYIDIDMFDTAGNFKL